MTSLFRSLKLTSPAHSGRGGLEYGLYTLLAALLILYVAALFFDAMQLQLGYAEAYARGELVAPGQQPQPGWSAPLDDVFIHFDFARSTARGYPFQWSEGNGYSSGGTSLLYPFTLALGYWAGFRKLSLMLWAAMVACVSCLAFLIAVRRLFSGLPRYTAWLAPPAFLCVGALNWSLFSGMEVAFFLGLWGAALVAWDDLIRAPELFPKATPLRQAALLGLCGMLLAATRPEGAVLIALFGCSAAWVVLKRQGAGAAIGVLAWCGIPAALVLVGHAAANKWFTGYSTAAGALVKLEMHHPHLSSEQVLDAWVFHVKYQVLRVTHYHLSEQPGWGWILWFLGGIALIPRETRRYALMLWASATAWVLVVALNGQVRWQNERYSMPALAWLLMLAALGVGALVSLRPARGVRGARLHAAGVTLAALASGLFLYNQLPRFREQVWFFARASRNIRDQHLTAGALLGQLKPARVLVGDAGALTYQSDIPGLDIIGLGGYHQLPFARASQWGVPSAVELIQRMPASQRPDVMAIYPGWWGSLPLWFGDALAHVPVRGNVICGGADKVLYRANWSSLDHAEAPTQLGPGEELVDALDQADLVNEQAHNYRVEGAIGFVEMKLLPHPRNDAKDLWDAGRIIPEGAREHFDLSGRAEKSGRLVLRTAPSTKGEVEVLVNGSSIGTVVLTPADQWQEHSVAVPASLSRAVNQISLVQLKGERILYHVWLVLAD